MSKYHAKRINGYASKKEANRAAELHALQAAGVIANLQEQVNIEILPKFPPYNRPLIYRADFVYELDGAQVIEDAKGFRTPVYILKKRLLLQLRGLAITEV